MKVTVALFLAVIGVALAHPIAAPGEGDNFTNEAIRQAQNTALIPRGASIQNVQEAMEFKVVENIPADQAINLSDILGGQVPDEVIRNLQAQIDQVGKN